MKTYLLALLFLTPLALKAGSKTGFEYSTLTNKKKKSSSSGFDKTNLLLGPGLGFGAAQRAFSINISPSVAYCFTEEFHAGTTLGFNYFQQAQDYYNPIKQELETYRFKLPSYSLSVYARYIFFDQLILNFEPELNYTKFIKDAYLDFNGNFHEDAQWMFLPAVLVGGGYVQRLSNLGYGYMMVCYDLIQNPNARYYQTLDIRTGVMISLFNK